MSDPNAQIRAALTTITKCYPHTLEPARHGPSTHATTVTPQPPVSVSVLDTRATAYEVLAYWAALVIAGRKLQHLPAATVPALTAFLQVHADYLAGHKRVATAVTELEHSATALASIVADNAPHRFIVARCPVEDCAGLLRVTLRRDDDLMPSEIRCTLEAEHKWSPSMWKYIAHVAS